MVQLELKVTAPRVLDGIELVEAGRLREAQAVFVAHLDENPGSALAHSYVGLLMFLLDGLKREGLQMCKEASRKDPDEALCHLNLARVFHAMGDRRRCIQMLHAGLKLKGGRQDLLMTFFRTIGFRRRPVIPFLSRDNLLNKHLGKLTWRFSEAKKVQEAVNRPRSSPRGR